MEDELNWHGKPLGAKSDAAIAAVSALIKNPGPHGIKPKSFVDDAPKVDLSTVKLCEPPNYKLGEKVSSAFFLFLALVSWLFTQCLLLYLACHT